MAEERFLDALGAQAEEEMGRISARAEEADRRIREDALREAGRRKEDHLRHARTEARGIRSRIINTARLEARKTILSALHDLVDMAVGELLAETRALRNREDYRGIIEKLLDECTLDPGSRLLCSGEDGDLLRSIVEERGLPVSVEEHDDPGTGIVVISGDGTFVQRNTFTERIRRARPRITMAVAARILPGGEEV